VPPDPPDPDVFNVLNAQMTALDGGLERFRLWFLDLAELSTLLGGVQFSTPVQLNQASQQLAFRNSFHMKPHP